MSMMHRTNGGLVIDKGSVGMIVGNDKSVAAIAANDNMNGDGISVTRGSSLTVAGKASHIEAKNNAGGQGLAVEGSSRVDLGCPLVATRNGDRYNIFVDTCSSLRVVGDVTAIGGPANVRVANGSQMFVEAGHLQAGGSLSANNVEVARASTLSVEGDIFATRAAKNGLCMTGRSSCLAEQLSVSSSKQNGVCLDSSQLDLSETVNANRCGLNGITATQKSAIQVQLSIKANLNGASGVSLCDSSMTAATMASSFSNNANNGINLIAATIMAAQGAIINNNGASGKFSGILAQSSSRITIGAIEVEGNTLDGVELTGGCSFQQIGRIVTPKTRNGRYGISLHYGSRAVIHGSKGGNTAAGAKGAVLIGAKKKAVSWKAIASRQPRICTDSSRSKKASELCSISFAK